MYERSTTISSTGQQAEAVQLLDPLTVEHVRLTPRHLPHTPWIDHLHLDAVPFQNFVQRNPVHAGRFDRDRCDAAGLQPFRQGDQIRGESAKATHRLRVAVLGHCDVMRVATAVNARRAFVHPAERLGLLRGRNWAIAILLMSWHNEPPSNEWQEQNWRDDGRGGWKTLVSQTRSTAQRGPLAGFASARRQATATDKARPAAIRGHTLATGPGLRRSERETLNRKARQRDDEPSTRLTKPPETRLEIGHKAPVKITASTTRAVPDPANAAGQVHQNSARRSTPASTSSFPTLAGAAGWKARNQREAPGGKPLASWSHGLFFNTVKG